MSAIDIPTMMMNTQLLVKSVLAPFCIEADLRGVSLLMSVFRAHFDSISSRSKNLSSIFNIGASYRVGFV